MAVERNRLKMHALSKHGDVIAIYGSRKRAETEAIELARRDGFTVPRQGMAYFKYGIYLTTSDDDYTGYDVVTKKVQ